MSSYLDASALVAILLNESSSQAVQTVIDQENDPPLVSDFCRAECAAALTALARTRRQTEAEVRILHDELDLWIAALATPVDITSADIREANLLSRRFELKLRAPDAIHIAAASRLGARLTTLDDRMGQAAHRLNIAYINPVESSTN